MLGKLIKYEYKATAKIFLGLYIIVCLLTVGSKAMLFIQDSAIAESIVFKIMFGIIIASYIIALIAIGAVTFIVLIKRFYDNMLKDEGYLSFTLPVSVGQHIASKAIVSYSWMLATTGIILLSIFGLLYTNDVDYIRGMSTLCTEISNEGGWTYIIEVIIGFFVGLMSMIIVMYTCMSLGQLYTKHRIVGAVIAYIGNYTIGQIVNVVFLVILMGTTGAFEYNDFNMDHFTNAIMIFSIVYQIITILVGIVITHYILSRKLNLE